METKKLLALLEAVRLGSISKASEKMRYTQSGITQMLNSLETELGVPLLQRTSRGVVFTEEGKALEPFIRNILDGETALYAKVSELFQNTTERIRIGTFPSIASYWLPKVIKDFQNQHPNVNIEIKIGSNEFADWISSDEIDIGFADETQAGYYEWSHIQNDEIYAAIHSSDPISKNQRVLIETLITNQVLLPTAGGKSTPERILKGLQIKRKILVPSSSGETLLSLVSQGLGVTLVSRLYLNRQPDNVHLIPIDPPIIRKLGIFAKSFKDLNPMAKKFISCLRKWS